ncbi:MAG: hypothetical protein E7258_05965 [Lachnospiraceae bacterium]|nr:hypothetical protein [Lachnospiraceae bacterium]
MMNIDNGKISTRQCFRVGVLENIALGIIIIPYVTTSVAGRWHLPALGLGLIFSGLYGFIIFFLSKAFPEGFIEYIHESLSVGGKLIYTFYLFRYVIKISLITMFFGGIIQEYMLRSFNMWWIIIPFLFLSGYGGTKDIEKRGRLLELLFWWMVFPLILVVVFSISNMNWQEIPNMAQSFMPENITLGKSRILLGAYLVVLVLSTMELMMFTLAKQKRNRWDSSLRILLWILIAILCAHIFIVAILGRGWTSSSSSSVLAVMEATSFPDGTIERLDYPILAFWIIGVFAIVSGYMFYCKEFINGICGRKSFKPRSFSMPVVILLALLFAYLWSIEAVAKIFTWYVVWIDLAVSVIVPLVMWLVKGERTKKILQGTVKKRRKKFLLMLFAVIGAAGLTGCDSPRNVKEITQDINTSYKPLEEDKGSLENRDYVIRMEIGPEDGLEKYNFKFEIVDLSEYKGGTKGNIKTKDYECKSENVKEACQDYFKDKERQLDLGHIEEIKFNEDLSDNVMKDIVVELANNPSVAKSVTIQYQEKNQEERILLREMIKDTYTGEDF